MPIYLILDLVTLSFPLIFSFDGRVHFNRRWRYFFPGMIVTAVVFVVWDYLFTQHGVWSFNSKYLVGINAGILPIEELLFFIVVPFACTLIYDALKHYLTRDYLGKAAPVISLVLVVLLLVVGVAHIHQAYTAVTFLFTAVYLLALQFVFRVRYMGWFYLAYLVSLIPFALFNGVLTALPVVLYNNHENLSIRLYTIPIEDTMYSLLMLIMNISMYEWLQQRAQAKGIAIG